MGLDESLVNATTTKFTVGDTSGCRISSVGPQLTAEPIANDNLVYGGELYGTSHHLWPGSAMTLSAMPAEHMTGAGNIARPAALNTAFDLRSGEQYNVQLFSLKSGPTR